MTNTLKTSQMNRANAHAKSGLSNRVVAAGDTARRRDPDSLSRQPNADSPSELAAKRRASPWPLGAMSTVLGDSGFFGFFGFGASAPQANALAFVRPPPPARLVTFTPRHACHTALGREIF
ncbi:hypothetical protein ANO11243_077670 [Dothideomycetidae sp. 11243]|nr:hypothetical protein ANO11243_077670 [fungal sp. No.11243]